MLGIVAGVIVLVEPGISLVTLAYVAGVFLVVDGVFELAGALAGHRESRGMLAIIGVFSVIVGLYLVRHPIAGVVAVALVIGIWLVALGLVRLVDAFALRRAGRDGGPSAPDPASG